MKFTKDTFVKYLGQVVQYKDGAIILDENTAGGWVYVVAYGEVEIFKTIEGRVVTLDKVYEGEVLGEVSFFDKRTRSAGARAKGNVGLMQFDDAYLTKEYEKLPNCYRVILEAMAVRLRRTMKKATLLAANPKILKLVAQEMMKEKQKGETSPEKDKTVL